MTPHIIEKIQNEIDIGITRESQVLYILAEIRKILEQEDALSQYRYLEFHCNWVLHSKLDRAFSQKVLNHFNSAHLQILNGEELANSEADKISKMERFREELSDFFSSYNLTDITSSSNSWTKFLYLYGLIIQDTPLVIRNSNSAGIQEIIVSVELSKETHSSYQLYKVSWRLKDRDGRHGTIYVLNSFQVAQ